MSSEKLPSQPEDVEAVQSKAEEQDQTEIFDLIAAKAAQFERTANPENEYLHGEYACERQEILANPEHTGASFSEILGDARTLPFLDTEFKDLPENIQQLIGTKEAFDAKIQTEIDLRQKFREYIDSFDGQLKNARFHATPGNTPLSIINARRGGELHISDAFVDELQYAREYGVENITITASLAHPGEDGAMSLAAPEGQHREDYIGMINQLVSRMGGGAGLTIELGNETNETVNVDYEGRPIPISEEISPRDYADFYREVASRLKQKYPDLRLSIAGTSLADPGWLVQTINEIGDPSLIDEISMHPYRREPDQIWTPHAERIAVDYATLFEGRRPEEVSYDMVEGYLAGVADRIGAQLVIGEMQIGHGGDQPIPDHDAHAKMQSILSRSASRDIKTYIWPREGIPF